MNNEEDNIFEIQKELGRGGFATTYKARITDSKIIKKWGCKGDIVCIKIPTDKESSYDLSNEVKLNNAIEVNCTPKELTFLCEVHGIYSLNVLHRSTVVMVMEFMPEGNLRNKLNEKTIDTPKAVSYLKDILTGLSIVHRYKIIHRDIKPENILFKDGRARITDLGIGTALNNREVANTVAGTLPYMPPEMFIGKEGYTFNVDIWSVGVMFHEMLFGTLPFGMNFRDGQQVVGKITSDKSFRTPNNAEIPTELKEILRKSLNKDPKERYQTVSEVLTDLQQYEIKQTKETKEYQEYLSAKKVRDYKRAINILKKMIEKNPLDSNLYYEMGCTFQKDSRPTEALKIMKEGLDTNPDCAILNLEIGRVYEKTKEKKKAIPYLEKAKELGLTKKNLILANVMIKNIKEKMS
jgi:serine/threonine protein kinase